MALTWVIWAGSTARLRDEEALLPLPPEEEEGGGLLRYQRIAKKPTRATARSCGMLIEVSVWAMLADAVVCMQRQGAVVCREIFVLPDEGPNPELGEWVGRSLANRS
jgi:hypothetical protein